MINCHNEVNITVNNFQIYQGTSGTMVVGGLSGNGATFENCTNSGNITINIPDSSNGEIIGAGGIAGSGGSYITNCYNSGTITINGNNGKVEKILIGGVMGQLTGKLENCYNTGDIEIKDLSLAGRDPYALIGGVIGQNEDFLYIEEGKILYCYNTGNISIPADLSSEEVVMVGGILGASIQGTTISNSYCLTQDNIKTIGFGSTIVENNVDVKNADAFQDGNVAYELRKVGGNYGQLLNAEDENDGTPVLLAFKENKEKEVYKRTLNYDKYNGEAEQAEEKEAYVNSGNLCLPELNENEGWYDAVGNLYTNESTLSPEILDITLYAEAQTPHTITISETEGGKVEANKTTAIKGETITLVVTPDENYQLESITVTTEGGATIMTSTTEENTYTFIMPDENVTVSATFTKMEEQPGDDDEDQDTDKPGTIVKPIKYYNIYIDTICPGLNVEVSKDVVQEGHQVSAYLTIQSECDTTGMRFEYKRGLFGYWKDLKELEGVQPGEYIIKNIYTDIYIRALDATLPEEEPTGIEDLEGVKAYAKEGSIYVYTPNREEVMIIGMSGAIIKRVEQVGLQSYSVSRGIYIVRIGDKVFKLKN